MNRVQFVGLDQDHKHSLFDSYDPKCDIKSKPDISDKTSKLADKKRCKLLGEADLAKVKQVDIFLLPKLDKNKILAKKKELEDKEVEQCTFTP